MTRRKRCVSIIFCFFVCVFFAFCPTTGKRCYINYVFRYATTYFPPLIFASYKLIYKLILSSIQQSDNDDEEEEFSQEDDGTSVETKFLQIVQRMQLSHLETAALRLAIARNDISVREVRYYFLS